MSLPEYDGFPPWNVDLIELRTFFGTFGCHKYSKLLSRKKQWIIKKHIKQSDYFAPDVLPSERIYKSLQYWNNKNITQISKMMHIHKVCKSIKSDSDKKNAFLNCIDDLFISTETPSEKEIKWYFFMVTWVFDLTDKQKDFLGQYYASYNQSLFMDIFWEQALNNDTYIDHWYIVWTLRTILEKDFKTKEELVAFAKSNRNLFKKYIKHKNIIENTVNKDQIIIFITIIWAAILFIYLLQLGA